MMGYPIFCCQIVAGEWHKWRIKVVIISCLHWYYNTKGGEMQAHFSAFWTDKTYLNLMYVLSNCVLPWGFKQSIPTRCQVSYSNKLLSVVITRMWIILDLPRWFSTTFYLTRGENTTTKISIVPHNKQFLPAKKEIDILLYKRNAPQLNPDGHISIEL